MFSLLGEGDRFVVWFVDADEKNGEELEIPLRAGDSIGGLCVEPAL